MNWTHAGPSVIASFLASLVEFVEALTIVLAVGTVRGWRSALWGVVAGVFVLAVLVSAFGPAIQRVPINSLQIVVGILLLLFGLRWLRKATLRSAGIIGMHDEEAIYLKQTNRLREAGPKARAGIDAVAFATSMKAVVIEGLEVVFIVIATGAAGRMLAPAIAGAAAAGILVIILGVAIHKPLSRVPENTLKLLVGVILSAFGAFWVGEGLNFEWPAGDLAIPIMGIGFLLASVLAAKSIEISVRAKSEMATPGETE